MGLTFGWGGGSEDCSRALTEGVLPVSGAIAISDSAASPAPWSDESSSLGATTPDSPRPRLDWWWEIETLRLSISFLLRSISLLSLFLVEASDSAQWVLMRSSSSPQIRVRCPWRSASELSSWRWFSSRTRPTNSAKVRLPVIGARSRSTRGPFLCQAASRVWEATWFFSAATMSRRCSQVAIRRVLVLSMTLTSLIPQNPTPPVYLSKVWHLLAGHPYGGPFVCTPSRTGGLGLIVSVMGSLSPMTVGILTAYCCNFISRGVKGDSSPLGLDWQLHCLLIRGCRPTPGGWWWLAQGWCHLRSPWRWDLWLQSQWCRSPWCHSPQCLSLQPWSLQHLSLLVHHSSQ